MELTIEKTIRAFSELGKHILERPESLHTVVRQATAKNRWFEEESIWQALTAISDWLQEEKLSNWVRAYGLKEISTKSVGLILAGNLPLVGFHDLLSVLCSGFRAHVKLSSDDQILYHYLISQVIGYEKSLENRIEFVERLQNFDMVIATGSDNSARYFEYYFGNKPHIIRKNRTSIAVLNGKESQPDLYGLGHDILDYYGMGCRSVSKIYIPKNYDIRVFYEGIEAHKYVQENFKYFNNYEFQKSILLINRIDHLDNGFLLLKEDERLSSPLSVLYFERYADLQDLSNKLVDLKDSLQCVVSNFDVNCAVSNVGFGQSQKPGLTDYADQVDTLAFLSAQIS